VAIYGVFTFAISNWRIQHRRELNAADSEAGGRSVDALMNYETVKSFGAEARAADSYDQALATYTSASVKANSSLALLNVIQAVMMNVGLGGHGGDGRIEAAAGGWARAT
jgi:ABC-type transport system involved in Fe-S cluster assembly fused permease/ATPase subunit